ncbi:MAG: hypothetical protein COA86_03455 [Kangiella sp.]|nr:MAG: hypothetical protein COA86_03455 [Kangiella sp.]
MRNLACVFLFSLYLSGCAISIAGKDEFIELNYEQKVSTDSDITIRMSCPGKMYSMMVSVIVPLPPIIPAFWVNEETSSLYLTAPKKGSPSISFLDGSNNPVKVITTSVREGENFNDASKKDYYIIINKDCADLDGYKLIIVIDEVEVIYLLKYIEGKIKFAWTYLSA